MTDAVVRLGGATLAYGERVVWRDLSMAVERGTFVAVLGPNGSGKTSLLRVILGLSPLAAGTVEVLGAPARRGHPAIGYVPQQHDFDRDLPLRGRDFVGLGFDGHRWGPGRPSRERERRTNDAIASVGASAFADVAVGRLSGGEQQRLRIAQALVGAPELLLCDEPLAHLDLHHQREVASLIGGWQRSSGRTVLFVTHDVNPILDVVDDVVFVVDGRWAFGPPDEVLTSARLSALYGSHRRRAADQGRLLVVGEELDTGVEHDEPHGPMLGQHRDLVAPGHGGDR